jgi:hypothetical protein
MNRRKKDQKHETTYATRSATAEEKSQLNRVFISSQLSITALLSREVDPL